MKFLGEVLGALVVTFVILFWLKGDELLDMYAKNYIKSGEACLADPGCTMTFENYEDYLWALDYLENN